MAGKLELFVLGSDHMVEINKPWISTIKEFKKILARDRGSLGDAQGRNKLQAIREFTFIYHYCDISSKFVNYSKADMLKECLRNAELPEDLDIEKDPELIAAIIKYKSLQTAPSLELLREQREALHTGVKVVKKIRERLEKELLKDDLEELVIGEGKNQRIIDPVTKLAQWLSELMKMGNEIPRSIKTINELEEDVLKQLADNVVMRGEVEKGIREDGDFKIANRNPFAQ